MLRNPLGFNEDVINNLKLYEGLLKVWQNKLNLVSEGSLKDIWNRHIIDSAQLLSLLPNEKSSKIIYD